MAAKRKTRVGMNPLPSLIRASAWDAANAQMRKACRKAWSEDDYNLACETQERLIRAAYGRPSDDNQPDLCYIRFQIAEQLERAGKFGLYDDVTEISATIDAIMDAPMTQAAA